MRRLRRFRVSIVLFAMFLLAQVPLVLPSGAAEQGSAASGAERSSAVRLSERYVRALRASADGKVFVSYRESTGVVGFVRAGRQGDLLPGSNLGPAGKALGFFRQFGGAFGVRDASGLELTSRVTDTYGSTHLTYEQSYRGVPVFGAVLKVHLDAENRLTAVNGVYVPDISIGTTARLTRAQAQRLAIEEVLSDPPTDENGRAAGVSARDLHAESTKLLVYRTGLIRDVRGSNQLSYEVVVTNGANVREFVFVHAHVGKILNRYSAISDALHRVLYEMDETTPPVWEEGDTFPGSLNIDQQNILVATEDAYYHFFNAFGRDSYDAGGAFMRSVNNDPDIACPNANWNGSTTNYCNGVTADDVVAHEWGHAYTQFTHDLIYQWQSGALNESYSDIWGETVDFLNGYGTDAPGGAAGDSPRASDDSCTTHTLTRLFVMINSPASIAGFCTAREALFGPQLADTGPITGDLLLADDGVAPTSDGCQPLVDDAAGKIVLVDRGTCAFTVKVVNAQDAGAIGVLVADNVWGPPQDPLGGADPSITIPTVRIPLGSGILFKNTLATDSVNVTMRVGHSAAVDNVRWLMGEDATAFGTPGANAIRDMWNPRCVQDPGRVLDAEYWCSTLDGGGVHTNSGVPNHGYALLVDGGTYNGHTIGAIGLVKAAHLYFQAQLLQTPTTNFDGHADALEAACTALIGQSLSELSTDSAPVGVSGEVFDADDCAEVSEMIAALELRVDPAEQCNFQPVLQPGAPAHCSDTDDKTDPVDVYSEDFESGLGDWTLENAGVFSGWPDLDWVQDTTLPAGRLGAAAFGEDAQGGNCDGAAGDFSGHMMMTSAEIDIPDIEETTPRLSFEHYVATEAGWDGGNLKISVNGGSFFVPPDAAYTFNSYNVPNLNTAAQGNTNPLAGEDGWTGTDGGELTSTWGESQLNLAALGVVPGDTIQLRFDFGIDGCTGIDGWYVDNITVYLCVNADPTVAVVPGGSCDSANSATLNLTVSDAETEAGELVLSAASSNTGLVPNGSLVLGGTGADRTLRIRANPRASGTAVVTVTVTDQGGGTASTQFTVIVGTNGPDVLEGTSGPDVILGRNGGDTINGLGGIDLLCGWNGNDTLNGGSEDDTVSGGRGDDTLTGGTGADAFIGGPGTDTATDFTPPDGDTSTGVP